MGSRRQEVKRDVVDEGEGRNEIIIFSTSSTIETTVSTKTTSSIQVAMDLSTAFSKYSGVKLKNDNDVYEAGTDYLTQAYGDKTDGTDGGAFVEFEGNMDGSGMVPKYEVLPGPPDIDTCYQFCQYWFKNKNGSDKDNVFQLVIVNKRSDGLLGVTRDSVYPNIAIIFTTFKDLDDNWSSSLITSKETIIHEIGHHFGLSQSIFAHVDSSITTVQNHNNTDLCIMSYPSTDADNNKIPDGLENGITEFCTDCLYYIRDVLDPR